MVACYCLLGTAGHMTIITIETFMNSINPDDPRQLSDPGLNRAEVKVRVKKQHMFVICKRAFATGNLYGLNEAKKPAFSVNELYRNRQRSLFCKATL